MNDACNTLLCTEARELLETRDAELYKVLKLKLVLNQLRYLKLGEEETPEIKRALRLLWSAEYIQLGDEQQYLLGLKDCFTNPPPLSYTERKTLRTKLAENLRAQLTPIVELGDKIRAEMPDMLSSNSREAVQLNTEQAEIIKLQKERREGVQKLVEQRREEGVLMMTAADLKLGPHAVEELKMQHAQAELLYTKADLLRSYFINEIFSRTEHSMQAHKIVDKYLDELLQNAKQPKAEGAVRKAFK